MDGNANLSANNLTDQNVEQWRKKLNVQDVDPHLQKQVEKNTADIEALAGGVVSNTQSITQNTKDIASIDEQLIRNTQNIAMVNEMSNDNKTRLDIIVPIIDKKANKTDVDDALATKANTQYVNEELNKKVDKTALLNLIYPVGGIYISANPTSPASLFGGSWEQLASGKTLWTDANGGGGEIGAGLPNAEGYINAIWASYGFDHQASFGGVFSTPQQKADGSAGGRGWRMYNRNMNFSLASSNSIYGSSSTVQPPAIKVCMWKRTA